MEADVTHGRERASVRVVGELDDPVALLGAVHVALVDKPERMLLDLRECTAVERAGTSSLLAVRKLCERVGVPLELAPSPAVVRRLDAMGLSSGFRFIKA
jgi:anti-anti-sigma regulatory factor